MISEMIAMIAGRIAYLKRYVRNNSKHITLGKLAREFSPPIIIRLLILIKKLTTSFQTYSGVYSSFQECREKNRRLFSKSGDFDNPAYGQASLQRTKTFLASPVWGTLEHVDFIKLLACTSKELGRKGAVAIFDFGGGVGFHYVRCQRYLKNPQIDYTVFDVPAVVKIGEEFFGDVKDIHFTDKLPTAGINKFDIIILSSVLHYIDDYKRLLMDLTVSYRPNILFLGRLPAGDIPDFVTAQTIPEASFPAHCFNHEKLKEFCSTLNYAIEDVWDGSESFELVDKGQQYQIPHYKGMILRRIE